MRPDVSEVEIIRHGALLILRTLSPDATLASAFDTLTAIGDDFLPDGRQQGEAQEREAF